MVFAGESRRSLGMVVITMMIVTAEELETDRETGIHVGCCSVIEGNRSTV